MATPAAQTFVGFSLQNVLFYTTVPRVQNMPVHENQLLTNRKTVLLLKTKLKFHRHDVFPTETGT